MAPGLPYPDCLPRRVLERSCSTVEAGGSGSGRRRCRNVAPGAAPEVPRCACGAGNPEEGELRPQLLDRFGMHAEIRTVKDPNLRVQIVEQRADFDADPAGFRTSYGATQHDLTDKITAARKLLKEVLAADRRLPAEPASISSTLCRRIMFHRACRLHRFCPGRLACARGAAWEGPKINRKS